MVRELYRANRDERRRRLPRDELVPRPKGIIMRVNLDRCADR